VEQYMPEFKATLVVTATPNPEAMQDMQAYLTKVAPLLIEKGGKMVYRGKTSMAIAGNMDFAMLMVMNFESEHIIQAVFDSPEYAQLINLRNRAFKSVNILISAPL
jgi:uncharacterized protein (DUF1330 family)